MFLLQNKHQLVAILDTAIKKLAIMVTEVLLRLCRRGG